MSTDNIQEKLALLPEGLEEKNIASWEKVLWFYKLTTSYPSNSWLIPMVDMIQKVIDSSQNKLFRAGLQLYTLIISVKEEHGLDEGDHHIRVDLNRNNSIEIWYGTNLYDADELSLDLNKTVVELQPFLNKLWDETRGKKNA